MIIFGFKMEYLNLAFAAVIGRSPIGAKGRAPRSLNEWREDKVRMGMVLARKEPLGFSEPRHRLEAYATLLSGVWSDLSKCFLRGVPCAHRYPRDGISVAYASSLCRGGNGQHLGNNGSELGPAICVRLPLALPSVKAAVFIAVAEIDGHPDDQPSEEPDPCGQR
jgi:hypothetical protein